MEIPPVVIDRLPLYTRALSTLEEEGRDVVSSQELGTLLGVTPAQIRKDLSYFGRFGKQGRGYNVRKLLNELHHILGLDRQWRMAVIGVGKLGRAILGYEGFGPQGFRIVEAFDADPKRIGERIENLTIRGANDLEKTLLKNPVDVGIVAVPAESAQNVIDTLVKCGVRAILSYAPIPARVPPGVYLKRIEPVLALQSMAYYVNDSPRSTAAAARS